MDGLSFKSIGTTTIMSLPKDSFAKLIMSFGTKMGSIIGTDQ